MCGGGRWSAGVAWGPPPSTPHCLLRRELGLGRHPYRTACLAVRSVCAGGGPRSLRRCLTRTDAADSEYNVDRIYLHLPAEKRGETVLLPCTAAADIFPLQSYHHIDDTVRTSHMPRECYHVCFVISRNVLRNLLQGVVRYLLHFKSGV